MMHVVAIQVVIVNVCVQLSLLMPGNVIDMVFISNGGHKNFVVSFVLTCMRCRVVNLITSVTSYNDPTISLSLSYYELLRLPLFVSRRILRYNYIILVMIKRLVWKVQYTKNT
jgi:hypothetical protein